MSGPYPRAIRLATWFKVGGIGGTLVLCTFGMYLGMSGESWLLQLAGAVMVAFGIAAGLEVIASRIVLERDALHVVSLLRRQIFPRADLESASLDGGRVVIKKRDGSWLQLPDTGSHATSNRDAIDAWIKKPV